MFNHPNVKHPKEILEAAKAKQSQAMQWNDAILTWLTNHVLASVIMFDIALIIPLMVIRAPDSVKITLGVISGSWIQWWALPALQRSQNKIQAQNDAKADVDHETLTHLALLQDAQMKQLNDLQKATEEIRAKMK
jgi:predicted NBD/HSP70 family sugar kinase